MTDKLEFTGERFTPECEREIWYEHVHRYAFAAQFCRQARVLDAACGEGYGSAMLAASAAQVTGVDISADTIAHAAARYGRQENLDFECVDCTALPFAQESFDVVVSFETLEHLAGQQALLAEFRRVLKADGLLILSSPDKAEYADKRDFNNPFHVRELYRGELEALIEPVFPAFRVLGQKLMFHSVIFPEGESSQVTVQTLREAGELENGPITHAPMYFIALCAAREDLLPEAAAGLWLFDDECESVYRHYHHEIRKNMEAGGILAGHQARIEELEGAVARSGQPWWRRWMKRA
ncbi:MAG TPA: methyltransferase domain-containing protein [Xanthomonadales bacterium]|nr:methyltransferase domain-containing protein [Xanthomonadales bacterium]